MFQFRCKIEGRTIYRIGSRRYDSFISNACCCYMYELSIDYDTTEKIHFCSKRIANIVQDYAKPTTKNIIFYILKQGTVTEKIIFLMLDPISGRLFESEKS